jgi:large subunit ribosomal protein L4
MTTVIDKPTSAEPKVPVVGEVTGRIDLPVYNSAGVLTGKVSIDPAEFGGRINKQLLHDAVLMYLANRRAGTHSTLRRGEVAGSTRKLFRQKGTGNARVGNRRTNKRRGGGTAKGPQPRDYEYHLPRKALRIATRMALLSRFVDQEALILEDLHLAEPKTKKVAEILKALQISGTTCLIGTAGLDAKAQEMAYKSARNIRGVVLLPARELNAYAILRPKRLVLTKAALEELRSRK